MTLMSNTEPAKIMGTPMLLAEPNISKNRKRMWTYQWEKEWLESDQSKKDHPGRQATYANNKKRMKISKLCDRGCGLEYRRISGP